jgi:hypothetical protein
MSKARTLLDDKIILADGRFVAQVKVIEAPKSTKFPDGFKVRCVLIDSARKVPRLLLDNHEPFGYHLHTALPLDKNVRVTVEVSSYEDAIRLFIKEARKVVESDK